ncbi:MAG: hypothetical protein ACLPUG_00175 [Acidimicrobiales bacterium]
MSSVVHAVASGIPGTPWWQLVVTGAGATLLGVVLGWVPTSRIAAKQRSHDAELAEMQRTNDADVARRQRENDVDIAAKQRENDRLLAEVERQQARKLDAYIAVQRYLGNWLRPVQHRLRGYETDPPESPPRIDEIGYELEALLSLVASPAVEHQLEEFNKIGNKWRATLGHYELVDVWAKNATTDSDRISFTEQRVTVWKQLEDIGKQLREAAEIINHRMRTELGSDPNGLKSQDAGQ